MTQGIIDGLEVVEIDEQQGPYEVTAICIGERLGQGFVQLTTIGQAGQLVIEGEILDAALRRLALGNILEEDDIVADPPLLILHRRDDLPLGIGVTVGVQAQGFPLPAIQGVELVTQPSQPRPEIIAKMQTNHPLVVKAGDLAEGVIDPQDLELGIRDDDPFVSFKGHRRQPHQGIALQALQLGHHAHREDGQDGVQIRGPGLAREQQGEMAQDLTVAIEQRLGVVVLARGQVGIPGQGFTHGDRAGGPLAIELLAGHVTESILLDVDAVARQHSEPVETDPLRQPDGSGSQDMGQLVDQGLAKIEPRLGGERLRQLGQQGGLQHGKRRCHACGGVGAIHLAMHHFEGGKPATTEPLCRHILTVPERMVYLAVLIAQVTDELARLAGIVESCKKIGETRFIFPLKLGGPGVGSLPCPGFTRDMIRQAPLPMLPIIKPHHLGGLLLHLRLQPLQPRYPPRLLQKSISVCAHISTGAWQ